MSSPFVSIIVPCRAVDEFARECVSHCRTLEYENFEIILLPDDFAALEGASVVATGSVSPGRKRNIGASVAKGEILAYIDADAYPRPDWLGSAVNYLQGERVGAVGGPGLTPPSDGDFAHAQGAILSSFLVSGNISARYKGARPVESDDIHSVNFIAWKNVIEQAGGWNEQYWPGEDTLICLAIRKLGYRQLLAPDVVVYHHRRTTWKGYLRQISNYGIHRGYFAKRFPETSRRASYFLPSVLVIGILVGPLLSILFPILWWFLLIAILLYVSILSTIALRDMKNAYRVLIGVPLTHAVYGIGFLKGFGSGRLER
ncbi:MAG: glycosyltransferase [Thaumarchaeota archaeon]|nr:glycosyltransferase [Nitrososphaerota archaeon]